MGAVKAGDISFALGSVSYRSPVFLASGPAGYGLEYADLVDLHALGGVVTKTVTLHPRPGNPGRRLWETPAGLLNSVGLENVGARAFFEEKLPALVEAGVKTIVSLAAEDWQDYIELLELTAAESAVEAVELNLSCPNVERGGMAVGTEPDLLSHYVQHAKDVLGRRAVIAKLTPNVGDIVSLALTAERAGADAITAINTVTGMDIEPECGRPVFRRLVAGLSGPAIMPVALYAVWRIAHVVGIPVIGAGGISSVRDACKFFMAGSSAVQVGTAVFYDPELPERIAASLERDGVPPAIE